MPGPLKRYLFASDFDKTLTFNDTGYVPSELLGIATEEFERLSQGKSLPLGGVSTHLSHRQPGNYAALPPQSNLVG
jgi:hypothetical protein